MSVINIFSGYAGKSTYNAINLGTIGSTGPIGAIGATGPENVGGNGYFGPSDPANQTASAMEGMGSTVKITPTKTGNVYVFWTCGGVINGNSSISAQIAYGTGTAPVFGAALTGTTIGKAPLINNYASGAEVLLVMYGRATGLTLNTQYWFDLQYSGSGFSGNLRANQVVIMEI